MHHLQVYPVPQGHPQNKSLVTGGGYLEEHPGTQK